MGAPLFQVRDDVKKHNITVFSSNFTLYRDISARVMAALSATGISFEQYSIDEAFLEFEDGTNLGVRIQALKSQVERWSGIPVSVGVGKSMVIAKYAGERAKKGSGTHIIEGGSGWMEEMKGIHVGELWGVGRQTTRTFLSNGIETAYDIATADPGVLRTLYGIEGVRLREALRGERTVRRSEGESGKSIMSSRSFGKTTASKEVLLSALTYHITHAAEKMRTRGCAATRMSVSIRPRRHGKFMLHGGHHEILFDQPIQDTRVMVRAAKDALQYIFEAGIEYGKAGVVLSGFVPQEYVQATLFENGNAHEDGAALMETLDRLNVRYGGHTVHIGTLQKEGAWRTKSESRSPEYTTKWSRIPTVKS